MFQIRAGKIRRAIEEGQLATAEALQHKVIRRRESVFEESLKNSRRDDDSSSATAANRHLINNQQWLQSQLTEEPDMMMDDISTPRGNTLIMTSMDANLFSEPMSTFGLSDDDLMSSFTTFTAKLGDSLWAQSEMSLNQPMNLGAMSEDSDSTSTTAHPRMQLQTNLPSLSPPSLKYSPTASTASPSLSPSPWMPWTTIDRTIMEDPVQKQPMLFDVLVSSQPQSQLGVMPMAQQQIYPGISTAFPASCGQQPVDSHLPYPVEVSVAQAGLGDKQQQSDTWSQYMQYLLYQQELGVQPVTAAMAQQFPQQRQQQTLPQPQAQLQPQLSQSHAPSQQYYQAPDPHWQATMMTMMMDQSSTMGPTKGHEGLWSNHALAVVPGSTYQGQ
ncbi:hypothetical protein BGZ99_009172 [Dissophora globulifera]|uniref:Uncharacterized protein n=1 Tax=Dissophora globulifera TaxID=979702 RepID=A0A9P6UNP8_9FUNG|nr:hypothetical protein BGZ99_009172 [Dissophora globulifera]